ncbi:MAG: tetratricopeptide repeat protein [bacterium]|nr:tetratricopeptide repeat protein [bacterium]
MTRPVRRGQVRATTSIGAVLRAASPMLAVVVLTGCVSTMDLFDPERLRLALKDRGLDPDHVVVPFELTAEMRQWAHDVVPKSYSTGDKLRGLRDALFDADRMKLEYAWGHTGTAVDVFEDRRANCLSFTNLFLGMAREVGIPVFFLAVERVETYRKQGDLVVVSDHVAVGWGDVHANDLLVFDFSEHRNEGYKAVQPLPDLTAIAMFHSNRGAETLQEGRVYDAVSWLRTAVAIDPELAPAWVNLGVTLRRAGDLDGAEDAYKHALEIDPRMSSAYQNLAALLLFQGRIDESSEYVEAMRSIPNRNPYSYLSLGDISLRNGRLEDARRFYRRAVGLSRNDAEILAALGQLAFAQGDMRLARKMLKRAQKIDQENPRTRRLAFMIDSQS